MRDFTLILPEIILAITLIGIIVCEVAYHGEKVRVVSSIALLGLASAFVQTLLTYGVDQGRAFEGSITVDGLSLYFKLFFIGLATLAMTGAIHSREIPVAKRPEYFAIIIGSVLTMCVAASATDLLIVFLSLQTINLLAFYLAAYDKRSVLSTEAAIKLLAFGILSAALFLYGGSLLFMTTQTLSLSEMHSALMGGGSADRQTLMVAFMLCFMALSFQFSAFPMHLWAPDVLTGAPTPVSAFIAIGSRSVGFVVAIRLLIGVFSRPGPMPGTWQVLGDTAWPSVVALVSGFTMIFGAFLATRQQGAKRLVASLIVSQSGFLLIGLLVMNITGLTALLYGLLVELVAIFGAYYVIGFFVDHLATDRLVQLKGMLNRAVPESVGLILFLLCLIGLPPLPGFVGKFALIGAAVEQGWNLLAIIAILSIVLGASAVARLGYSLVGDSKPASAPHLSLNASRLSVLAALALLLTAMAIAADPLFRWTHQSLQSILW